MPLSTRPPLFTLLLLATLSLGLAVSTPPAVREPLPGNVILFIGDGMGPVQIQAAQEQSPLRFVTLPYQAQVLTDSAGGAVTDSAAAVTAMVTGQKVPNRAVSKDAAGRDLLTLGEIYQRAGKRLGLVTTDFLEGATTAPLVAHAQDRGQFQAIVSDYFQQARPEVLLGGRTRHSSVWRARAAGYTVVTDRRSLKEVSRCGHLAGLFGRGGKLPFWGDAEYSRTPSLPEMTEAALMQLEDSPEGFLLVVESSNVDKASHLNEFQGMVAAVRELDRAVKTSLAWDAGRRNTLMLVTSDHETGGLQMNQGRATWATKTHTDVDVPLYATGPGAEKFQGLLDNTQLFRLLTTRRVHRWTWKVVAPRPTGG